MLVTEASRISDTGLNRCGAKLTTPAYRLSPLTTMRICKQACIADVRRSWFLWRLVVWDEDLETNGWQRSCEPEFLVFNFKFLVK